MKIDLFMNTAVAEGNFLLCELLKKIVIEDDSPAIARTNGFVIKVNSKMMDQYSTAEQYGILCHEARHIMYRHVEICKKLNLNPALHNVACDIIINEQLLAAKRKLPVGHLTRDLGEMKVPDHLKTSLEIYHWLEEQQQELSVSMDYDMDGDEGSKDVVVDVLKNSQLEKEGFSLEKDQTKRIISNDAKDNRLDIWKFIRIEAGRLTNAKYRRNYRREGRPVEGCITPSYRANVRTPLVKVFIDASGSMRNVIYNIINGLKAVFAKGKMYKAEYYLFDTKIGKYIDDKDVRDYLGGTDLDLVAENLDGADMYFVITDCEGSMDKLNETKKNLYVLTNNKKEVRGKVLEVDDEFENIICGTDRQ